MKKDELKKAFEYKFRNIKVSEELKNKTLKSINISTKKPSIFHYMKNFAAIFVVTLLCISIYLTRNLPKNPKTQNNPKQEISGESILRSTENITASPSHVYGTYQTTNNSLAQDSLELSSPNNAETILKDFSKNEKVSIEETSILEDDFLTNYPEAKKIEKGYVLYENNKEILYIFKNGTLENIIILE